MVMQTGFHPGELKDSVTSPSGSTISGVFELEKAGFRFALINAVQTSSKRAYEIGLIENYDTASEATYASRDILAYQQAAHGLMAPQPRILQQAAPKTKPNQKSRGARKGRRTRRNSSGTEV